MIRDSKPRTSPLEEVLALILGGSAAPRIIHRPGAMGGRVVLTAFTCQRPGRQDPMTVGTLWALTGPGRGPGEAKSY